MRYIQTSLRMNKIFTTTKYLQEVKIVAMRFFREKQTHVSSKKHFTIIVTSYLRQQKIVSATL